MSKSKGFVKLLAAGAVLGAVAAMIHDMKDKDSKTSELSDVAMRTKNKVLKHAKKLGVLSKEAYGKIVDTTVAEYHGVKALTAEDLKDIAKELKSGWKDVQAVMKSKPAAKKKRA